MRIPTDNWTQTNNGTLSGVLHSTGAMSFDAYGQAALARKPVAVATSDTDADFEFTMAIVHFDSNYQVVTSDRIFYGELDGGGFTENATFTPSTTLASDAVVFNSRLVVTTSSNINDWDGAATVRTSLASLTASVPHPMCIFDSLTTYKLAVGNGNQVKTYDTSFNANSTVLSLPSQFQVTTLRYRNGYLYIGTKNLNGGEARIFIWNGSGTSAQYECPVGAEWVFSMCEYGSSVAAIVSSGQLIQVSGSQFVELAALPVYHIPHAKWQGQGGLTLNGKVFNRGMTAIGDTIYLNIEGETDVGFIPEMKSGLWVYDPAVGLYHRATTTTDLLLQDSSLSLSNNTLTTSATHNLKEGDAVCFSGVSGLSGVSTGVPYYVTIVATNQIKLSLSREGVKDGRYVTITGTPGGSDVLCYAPNTNNGLQLTATSGAIALASINETPLEILHSEVLWGARTEDSSGNTEYVLNCFADQNNVGTLETQRIYPNNIEETWQAVYAFLDGLVTDEDKVVIKASTTPQPKPVELDGVWASSTQLNGTVKYAAWGDIEIGDELVFVSGRGQGRTAHVTDIDSSVSTYTITVDEAIGTAADAVSFYRTPFQKLQTFTVDEKDNEHIKAQFLEKNKSPWVAFKVELRGAETTLYSLDVPNVPHKST